MRSQVIIAYGKPLAEVQAPTPRPKGTEVLLEVRYCGVCHTDVHFHEGWFDLGGGKKLEATMGRKLPFALGHEVAGVVVDRGPEASDAEIGATRLVFPWIGCRNCVVCASGDEHLCAEPRSIGVTVQGGFATHLLVPHPRYLLECKGPPCQ
jgi:D-arabinose 1-dehydrogenase-like Zn-dependent alcohol dehydrogenase